MKRRSSSGLPGAGGDHPSVHGKRGAQISSPGPNFDPAAQGITHKQAVLLIVAQLASRSASAAQIGVAIGADAISRDPAVSRRQCASKSVGARLVFPCGISPGGGGARRSHGLQSNHESRRAALAATKGRASIRAESSRSDESARKQPDIGGEFIAAMHRRRGSRPFGDLMQRIAD